MLLFLLIVLTLGSGCVMTGGSAGTTPAPSPTTTSFVIVETETAAQDPVPATLVPTVNATPAITAAAVPPRDVLESGGEKKPFEYSIRTRSQLLYYTTYDGVRDYLRDRYPDRPTDFYNISTLEDYYRQYVSDPVQKSYLDAFVENVNDRSTLRPDRARIAVSLIQHIPYAETARTLYPYEVLYYDMGKCEDKSILMAYVLSDMGYGTALLLYYPEHHMALGLKCPKQYSIGQSGYCFVETTTPSIMTFHNGSYTGIGKLTSTPEIIRISDGDSFDQISEEYADALTFDAVLNSARWDENGMYLDTFNYDQMGYLRQKYGLFEIDPLSVS
ncbi:MAG: hypothetical protein WCX22_10300 [Methanoregula sp.]